MNEISVIVKDSERRYKRDFVEYEPFCMSADDPIIKKCIDVTLEEFKGEPESIQVKVHLEIK